MAQLSDQEVRGLFVLAHDNTGLAGVFDALDAMRTLCRAVEPLAVEVQRLRQQTAMDAQTVARLREQVRTQDTDLTVLRAQVKALVAA
jgi:hypothetical protein